MKVEQVQIKERPLIDAYRFNFQEVQEFFQYDPSDPKSFEKRYQYLQSRAYPRANVCQALARYNQLIGASQATMENIERLADERTVAVVTGQQAGVLTGPLYTIYKAITVIQLAKKLSNEGIPTVPVFWIASEDHDFLEIATTYFLNRHHEEVELSLSGDGERQPIGRIHLVNEVQILLDELMEKSLNTEFKLEMILRLREMAESSSDLAQWFGRIMAWLLAETGLIFVDALDSTLRQLGRNFFHQVIEQNEKITKCLKDAEERLTLKEYPAQIHKKDHQVHLFLIDTDGRYPLDQEGNGYILRGTDRFLTKEDLQKWIDNSPETVSTNVVTRPIFQDLLFPTIAYVGGPGETAYYAQYRGIYSLFNMEMPIIYPRISITLVEPTIAKGLRKVDLTPEQIFTQFAEIKQQCLNERDELDLKGKFNRIKGLIIPEYQKLIKEIQSLDDKFKDLGKQNLQRIIEEINYLEEKANHQHRKNSEDILRQLEKIKINLQPNGVFQERRFNIFPYLFKYQRNLIHHILDEQMLSFAVHYFIYL